MPKRPPTPPTVPTGKYLTVHQPYPPEPNMELTGHRKEVAFWISNCLGNDQDLTAMYHKPKSDKIILEIRDTFKDWRVILGEHRWEEILKVPAANEKEQCSQIFYCRFTHDREVQKHGWKRIDVPQSWFRDWQLFNGKIICPYPLSHFCEVPTESPTSAPLCRPLPVEYWPRVLPKVEAKATAPVPGSVEWFKAKESNAVTGKKSAWAKGPAKTKAAKSTSSAPPGISKPVDTWNYGSGHSSAALHAPSPVTPFPIRPNTDAYPGAASNASGQSYGTAWASATPGLSPSNPSPNARDSSDSGSAGTTPCTPESAALLVTDMSSVSISGAPSAGPYFDGDDEGDIWGDNQFPQAAGVSEYAASEPVEAQGSLWDDYGEEEESQKDPDAIVCNDEGDIWGDNQFPQAAGVSEYAASEPVEAQGSLWDDYGEEEESQKDPDAIVCNDHGSLCKKGICSQYNSQLRAVQRAKVLEERSKKKKAPSKNDGDWKKGNARPDKVKCPTEPRVQRNKPAHLMNPRPSSETPPARQTPQASSAFSVNPDSTNTAARQKPTHLATSNAASPAEPNTPRPIRGRRMNTNPNVNANNVNVNGDDGNAPPIPATTSATENWGYIPRDPYGGSTGAPSVHSKANGGNDGWGHVRRDMFGDSVGAPSIHSKANGGNDGWGHVRRDMFGDSVGAPSVHSKAMHNDDDTKSVAASSTGGWGHPPDGPWGPTKAPSNAGSGSAGGKGKAGKGKNKGKGKSPAFQTTGKEGGEGPQKGASWADQVDQADASPDAGLLPSDGPWS